MEIALLGHMGRDEVLADKLLDHKLHIIGEWVNPGLHDKSVITGGTYNVVDSIKNTEVIGELVKKISPDMFITNFDDALEAGVVDKIHSINPEILIPSPSREASRIEWDKFYLRKIIDEIDPSFNPINFMCMSDSEINVAMDYFEDSDTSVAIKPRNLSGGKGVKVMGAHLNDFAAARKYALDVINLENQSGVEVQEKIIGNEFTLQLITDGNNFVLPPETYDYPYREDGDIGPGTGGMGTFSMKPGEHLPFVTDEDYNSATHLMRKVLEKLKNEGIDYKGVLYPTFFKTNNGELKIVEINARGGDPEFINIMDLIEEEIDVYEMLTQISNGELDISKINFKKLASAMIYLVSPEYGYGKSSSIEFEIKDYVPFADNEVRLRFAAAEKIKDNRFRTVGTSRTLGLCALADTPWEARTKIMTAMHGGFKLPLPLDFRRDIAEYNYIHKL